MTPIQQLMLGVGAKKKTYVDDVFSTYLWAGNATAARSINNGINLSGEGGMTWIKNRTTGDREHVINDTVRSAGNNLMANSTAASQSDTNKLSTFTSTGFSIGTNAYVNGSSDTYSSWSFRKAPGFFDVVTYTGTGSSVLTLSHDLGSVPGMILIKRLDGASTDWIVYHRSTGISNYLKLNATDAAADDTGDYLFNNVAPTATHFTIGAGHDAVNANTNNYVAYLFAHDEQSFGENENASVIKCGSYTGNGQANEAGPFINLGWEPQFLLIKNTSDSASWAMFDTMRGIRTGGKTQTLSADLGNAEGDYTNFATVTSTGFHAGYNDVYTNSSGDTYVYLAIRRPDGYVGKPAEAGTDVFAMDTGSGSSGIPTFDSGFPVDFAFERTYASSQSWYTGARLIDSQYLTINSTAAAAAASNHEFDSNTGWESSSADNTHQSWMWKRHAGFDVVTYNGTGANRTQAHGLGRVPEMIVVKKRNSTQNWYTYHKGLNGGTNPELKTVMWNSDSGEDNGGSFTFNDTAPTSTVFSLASSHATNGSGDTYIAMLFASVDGICKVGYYSGSSSSQTITTGFQPRFVIIKSTSSSRNWCVFDTTRGWGSGNDQELNFNKNDAQGGNNDFGAPTSTGFTLETGHNDTNSSGKDYIYYAHA